jgi:hypothetical protein
MLCLKARAKAVPWENYVNNLFGILRLGGLIHLYLPFKLCVLHTSRFKPELKL